MKTETGMTFFKIPALRDELKSLGADEKRVEDLITTVRQRTPNRVLIPRYVAEESATWLKWDEDERHKLALALKFVES